MKTIGRIIMARDQRIPTSKSAFYINPINVLAIQQELCLTEIKRRRCIKCSAVIESMGTYQSSHAGDATIDEGETTEIWKAPKARVTYGSRSMREYRCGHRLSLWTRRQVVGSTGESNSSGISQPVGATRI